MGFWDEKNNAVVNKSKAFALRIINMYKHLTNNKIEYVIVKQALRSGTSIGANIREALSAQSTADFISKMQIALKETSETEYWLELLEETEYIPEDAGKSMHEDCKELLKMITAILKTTKDNQSK